METEDLALSELVDLESSSVESSFDTGSSEDVDDDDDDDDDDDIELLAEYIGQELSELEDEEDEV